MREEFNTLEVERAIDYIPSTEINGYEAAVLQFLARHANRQNESWHSICSISARIKFSRDTVLRSLKKLETKGLIFIQRPQVRHRYSSNTYTLAMVKILSYKTPAKHKSNGSSQPQLKNSMVADSYLNGSCERLEPVADSDTKKEIEKRKEESRPVALKGAPAASHRKSEEITPTRSTVQDMSEWKKGDPQLAKEHLSTMMAKLGIKPR